MASTCFTHKAAFLDAMLALALYTGSTSVELAVIEDHSSQSASALVLRIALDILDLQAAALSALKFSALLAGAAVSPAWQCCSEGDMVNERL